MKEKHYLEKKTVDGKEFFYLPVGSEDHGRPTYVLWIARRFVKTDEKGYNFIEFPVEGCSITTGKGRGLILRPGDKNLFKIVIPCGYRGRSYIENIICEDEPQVYKFLEFHSPRGSTGVDEGALILTRSPKVKVEWSRTGRLYGDPSHGITVLYLNGQKEELNCVDSEDLELLERELE
ncbi:MAG: hypothetical protein JHC31_07300 [Sulfurihydrogenibium sp.]|nr:hypothetical protein [Sulfurihydrogenibium sp.]